MFILGFLQNLNSLTITQWKAGGHLRGCPSDFEEAFFEMWNEGLCENFVCQLLKFYSMKLFRLFAVSVIKPSITIIIDIDTSLLWLLARQIAGRIDNLEPVFIKAESELQKWGLACYMSHVTTWSVCWCGRSDWLEKTRLAKYTDWGMNSSNCL